MKKFTLNVVFIVLSTSALVLASDRSATQAEIAVAENTNAISAKTAFMAPGVYLNNLRKQADECVVTYVSNPLYAQSYNAAQQIWNHPVTTVATLLAAYAAYVYYNENVAGDDNQDIVA